MERTQKIAAIRAACIKANPEIRDWCKRHEQKIVGCFSCSMSDRPIRLADVLLAIDEKSHSYSVNTLGYFEKWTRIDGRADTYRLEIIPATTRYNLRTDDLTAQSDETITFIHSLLTV